VFNLADPVIIDPTFAGGVDEGARFVSVLGTIPAGLPKLDMPAVNFELIVKMLPGAVVVMFIGFMEVCSVTKAIAANSKEKVDLNQELIGQGISAVAGSFSGCYPTSGSFSRSALNYASGARTGLSSIFTAVAVLLTLLFLTDFLVYLPQPVLAAIIIMAVVRLIDFNEMAQAWKISRYDGVGTIVTFVASLLFAPNIVNGVLIGGGLALMMHLHKTMKPKVTVLCDGKELHLEHDQLPASVSKDPFPEVRFHGRLYFANVSYFEEKVRQVVQEFTSVDTVIIRCRGINEIDVSGVVMLRTLIRQLHEQDVNIAFVGLKPQIIEVLGKSGITDLIGSENLYGRDDKAKEILIARLHAKMLAMREGHAYDYSI